MQKEECRKILPLRGLGILMILLAGCKVGPNYQRPAVDSPQVFRRAASDATLSHGTNSFADLGWWDVYDDHQLKIYIREALTNNWDVKIAAARVLEAEASAQITRSQFFPTVNAGGDLFTSRSSEKGPVPVPSGVNPEQRYGDVFLSMPAYELDLWGRIRRANEAARARLLQSEEAQHIVRQTLVSDVATTYLQLLELDMELQIGYASYTNRTNSLVLTQSRQEGGVSSLQDVYQAKVLVYTAQASIATTSRLIEQTENAMNILLGRNPGTIHRSASLNDYKLRASVPPGLPSSLLERRPDIRAAEQDLIAANADIGQAKAAFFPRVTLTGAFGYQTVALSDLFTAPARTWQFGPSVSFPLFTGGRLRGNLNLARATFEESLARYQQTVQNAFREVSDALIAYQRNQEFYARQKDLTQADRDAAQLAAVRYEGGVTSYLEVLYNEQQLFDAELQLAQARRDELLSVVELYRALGGGWETPVAARAAEFSNTAVGMK
ncbi:MAG TPA: efflux transporter outer membrane subunit [Candidatus Angelobacter sp.]|nr:efflux transporter outer membrane subunit [Candidatus Angelobacter sp.]